ncbi:unnamed protein product [Callosobruchus maculatus]|uniref:Uncharacterized protein n=1 Tax=Callosobruchus maculatus TaxID=64391 RepID=A0A653D0Y2_CALMS|nr:unnamed protein product [Callosobruchus maculatus]
MGKILTSHCRSRRGYRCYRVVSRCRAQPASRSWERRHVTPCSDNWPLDYVIPILLCLLLIDKIQVVQLGISVSGCYYYLVISNNIY